MFITSLQSLRRILSAALFIVLGFYFVNGQQTTIKESELSLEGFDAYQKLLTARGFYLGGIGVAGVNKREECDFRILLKEKNSIKAFQSLVNNANYEGGLYGLFGLWLKDKEMFKKAFDLYKSKEEPPERKLAVFLSNTIPKGNVEINGGGFYTFENVVTVLNKIKAGKYEDLWHKDSTCQ